MPHAHSRGMVNPEMMERTEEFRTLLNLSTYPVGVKLFERASEALTVKGARVLRATAPCHMAALARYYRRDGVTVATAQPVLSMEPS